MHMQNILTWFYLFCKTEFTIGDIKKKVMKLTSQMLEAIGLIARLVQVHL